MFVLMPRHLANLRRNRGQSFDDPAPEPTPPSKMWLREPEPESECTCTTPDAPICERCESVAAWEALFRHDLEEFEF